MSGRQSPVVWGILLFSLALRLAVLLGMLAFVGWLVFTILERDLARGLAILLPIFVFCSIAFYIGGRLGWKHGKALKELQERQRARREAAAKHDADRPASVQYGEKCE